MEKTTILEKLKIVFEVSKSSKLFIAVIAFIILLAIVALTTTRKNAKRNKRIYAGIYALILIAIVIIYHDSLGKMFDYMMNNFFIVLYFPNIAVYLAAIIITNIILWTSVLNLKNVKLVRYINITVYSVIHYLLALVLNIISTNDLDVFSQTSLYSNANIQAIIELSSAIFVTWIVFLIVYKVIRKYQLKGAAPVKQKVVVKQVRRLPENIKEVKAPEFVKAQPKKIEELKELTEEPVIIGQFVEQETKQKELEAEVENLETQLKLVEEQLKVQEQIQVKQAEQIKFEQAEKLKYQQAVEDKRKQIEKLEKEKQPKADATTAIMQSLDNVLTLEDYKVLSTLLKDKQKRKNDEKAENALKQYEQQMFSHVREAYKGAR